MPTKNNHFRQHRAGIFIRVFRLSYLQFLSVDNNELLELPFELCANTNLTGNCSNLQRLHANMVSYFYENLIDALCWLAAEYIVCL